MQVFCVVHCNSGSGYYPRPMMMEKSDAYAMAGASADQGMAKPAGEEDITVNVSITYELR